jgi:hypothetical protein
MDLDQTMKWAEDKPRGIDAKMSRLRHDVGGPSGGADSNPRSLGVESPSSDIDSRSQWGGAGSTNAVTADGSPARSTQAPFVGPHPERSCFWGKTLRKTAGTL